MLLCRLLSATSQKTTKYKFNNKERLFYMLEQIHILPNVSYLSKIRNTDMVMSTHDDKHDLTGDKAVDQIYQQHL